MYDIQFTKQAQKDAVKVECEKFMIDFRNIQKIIFSSPLDKTEKFAKLAGRRIKIKDGEYIQFEGFYNNKAFHENIAVDSLVNFFGAAILKYKRADIFLSDSHYMAFNKNNKISYHKTKEKIENKSMLNHNRNKNYIINEGDNIPILCELGIFNKDFQVIKGMYSKFKQINNFIEIIDSGVKDSDFTNKDIIKIIDFGCGNSYLTFALYYYFVNIKKFRAEITGIDLQEDIIKRCTKLAEKYNYANLFFERGDIKNYKPEINPDIIISLHGCNTATDYAIYNGIKWGVGLMFVAPCCQHEINAQIKRDALGDLYAPLRYGVLKDRFASVLTDGLRANILELFDYKTDIAEFVGFNHSPKNLLIKAVKSSHHEKYKNLLREQINKFISDFNINPTLWELINLI
ncbi:MAG: SAM-dependent methyltransferase [Oscillospiraceae bacterium]|nr:SAM-dependent methyltransferase [Oscillospiraceae bacterium]